MEHELFKAEQHIKQLCGMVNTYSNKLGLGQKVREADFIEPIHSIRAAIAKAEGEA